MNRKWTARPINGTARVEILDHQGCLVCVTDDRHADDIVGLAGKANALDTIHAELDGTEWDSGTMSVVASHLIGAGYVIRASNEEERADDN